MTKYSPLEDSFEESFKVSREKCLFDNVPKGTVMALSCPCSKCAAKSMGVLAALNSGDHSE